MDQFRGWKVGPWFKLCQLILPIILKNALFEIPQRFSRWELVWQALFPLRNTMNLALNSRKSLWSFGCFSKRLEILQRILRKRFKNCKSHCFLKSASSFISNYDLIPSLSVKLPSTPNGKLVFLFIYQPGQFAWKK